MRGGLVWRYRNTLNNCITFIQVEAARYHLFRLQSQKGACLVFILRVYELTSFGFKTDNITFESTRERERERSEL